MSETVAYDQKLVEATYYGIQHNRRPTVNPPWAELNSPSIQLSILVPIVRAAGFSVNAVHANLEMARFLQPSVYEHFATSRHLLLLGERMFSSVRLSVTFLPDI